MSQHSPNEYSEPEDKTMGAVPADFPRNPFPTSLTGSQLKFSARKIGDRYIVGLTAEELQERYEMCQDLAGQLIARTKRKKEEGLVPDIDAFYSDTERRIRSQSERDSWDFSEPELKWIFEKMRANVV